MKPPTLLLAPAAHQALAALSMVTLLSSLGVGIANVALPTLALAFDSTFQEIQWVVLAYLLAVTTLVVSVGRLGDLVGRRRLLISGLVLFTAAATLCGLATQLWQLITARALQGLGAAVMMALTLAFAAGSVPKSRTGSAMGVLGTMSAIGTALGPTLGGALITTAGWQYIFWVQVPVGLLAVLFIYRFLPPDASQSKVRQPPRFDYGGTLLLALSLAAFALAMTLGRGQFSGVNAALLLCAVVGVGLFIATQRGKPFPLVRFEVFANPAIGTGFAANLLVTTVVMATLIVGPFYLGGALSLDSVHVGMVMSTGPLVAALAGVPAGRLVDRFSARRMSLLGLGVMATGSAALAPMALSAGLSGYIGALALLTAGYALFQGANNTSVMADISAEQRGVVSGMLNLSRNLGLIAGASAMGVVYSLGVAATALPVTHVLAVTGGMIVVFGISTLLVLVSFALICRNVADYQLLEC